MNLAHRTQQIEQQLHNARMVELVAERQLEEARVSRARLEGQLQLAKELQDAATDTDNQGA